MNSDVKDLMKSLRFRRKQVATRFKPLRENLEKWSAFALPVLEDAQPYLPDELKDRAADVWEPLFSIADLAGGTWPEDARSSAVALCGGGPVNEESTGVDLLRDLRQVFVELGDDRIPGQNLADSLAQMEESPWGDLRGRPVTSRDLAGMLKPFQIRPTQIRFTSEHSMKGYFKVDFMDAWSRYIPVLSETSETAKQIDLPG